MNLWQSMGQISQGLLRSKDFVPHTTIPAPRMLERRLQSGSDPLLAEAEELGVWGNFSREDGKMEEGM